MINMRTIILKPALIALACMSSVAFADSLQGGCDTKAAKIQQEINYAKAQGNTHRVAGLETALAEVKQHCTDEGLAKELNQGIAEKQQKVTEREADLKEAQAKGDPKKIAKQQKKLAEAKQELVEAQQKAGNYTQPIKPVVPTKPTSNTKGKGGCDIKVAKIEKEIAYAKAHGNKNRVAGLEKSLAEVKANCNDQDLRADMEQKVTDKQRKVVEREADLKEAQVKGDTKKIAKQQKKLAEAKQELLEAQQKLTSYSK